MEIYNINGASTNLFASKNQAMNGRNVKSNDNLAGKTMGTQDKISENSMHISVEGKTDDKNNSEQLVDTVSISGGEATPQSVIENQLKAYREMLQTSKKEAEAKSEESRNYLKAMQIAMRIMHGDKVPAKDEQFLMKTDMKLYMQAKTMQMPNNKPKKYKSIVEDEEDQDKNDTSTSGDTSVSASGEGDSGLHVSIE